MWDDIIVWDIRYNCVRYKISCGICDIIVSDMRYHYVRYEISCEIYHRVRYEISSCEMWCIIVRYEISLCEIWDIIVWDMRYHRVRYEISCEISFCEIWDIIAWDTRYHCVRYEISLCELWDIISSKEIYISLLNCFKTTLKMISRGRNMQLYWASIKICCVRRSFVYFFPHSRTHDEMRNCRNNLKCFESQWVLIYK